MTTNPFSGTGFDMVAMTAAINKLPMLYKRTAALFPDSGITTTSVMIEQRDGTLNIIRSRPRGAAPDKSIADKRSLRPFAIPHIPIEDVLLPDDYQNVRAFGSETSTETASDIMARKLARMKNAIDQTREYLRMGALKGIILDADGTTMYNLYEQFGITAQTINLQFTDVDLPVLASLLPVKRHIETHLFGESMSGIRCLCSSGFYDALTGHPLVKDAYRYYTLNGQNLAGDYRGGFTFAGIVFEEYGATWTDKDGTARPAIAANQAHCFPEGTGSTFETIVAPGNFIETANTVGLPYYARQEPRKFNAGIDLWAESNSLPICKRPEVLVKLTIS